jgi:hypothetical protein
MKMALLWSGPRRSTRPVDLAATTALIVGGGLIIWSSAIHLHLWDSVGYRSIPTIGPLFLLQSIAGLVIGLAVLVFRQVWVAVLGFGFALSTLGGFLLSVTHGLFGFTETWQAPFAMEAFAIELTIAVVLAIAGALCLAGSAPLRSSRVTPLGSA